MVFSELQLYRKYRNKRTPPGSTNHKFKTNTPTHTHASSKRIRDDGAEEHTIPRPSAFICVSTGSYRMIRDRISIIVFHLRYIC